MEENGGINLYGFVGNDGIARYDIMGFSSSDDNKPHDEDAMIEVIHSGASKAHKDAEDEFMKIDNAGAKVKVYEKSFSPGLPREYGGRVCEVCTEDEEGKKKYTYRLTTRPGDWTPGKGGGGSVLVGLADKCEEVEKQVAFWHTHPSLVSSYPEGRGTTKDPRVTIYYWAGGSASSNDDNADEKFLTNDMLNPDGLPLYVTYRNGPSYNAWQYRTDEVGSDGAAKTTEMPIETWK